MLARDAGQKYPLPTTATPSPDYQRDLDDGIDYFELLGVPEEADAAEIVSAFRAKVRAVHPDGKVGGGDPDQVAVLARARSALVGPDRPAYEGARLFHLTQRYLAAVRAERARVAASRAAVTPSPEEVEAAVWEQLRIEEEDAEAEYRRAMANLAALQRRSRVPRSRPVAGLGVTIEELQRWSSGMLEYAEQLVADMLRPPRQRRPR